ncbi:MAG: NADPH-dependent F420 reductase [SAR202 cluster bacterium Casp-Chloro-G4]|nr:NADPH-dependent F420 reductase [Chloroflexota bacterium]MDA1227408.1 NADPH-dependent F420 reductase [Chloroflexota bacterium]PKB62148.1 MAG: NADPH-dependent F420 reductase [SAR202 cluster bacterium Casp-Chloro-G4]
MIGFIGGTGPEGKGLALRFALAGEKVLIGSRDEARAKEAADSLAGDAPPGSVEGKSNADVARESDIVFIAVPYSAQRPTLESLKELLEGKLMVNVIAPLAFDKGRASAMRVEAGSAAEEARDILPNSPMVAAFHNISAQELLIPDRALDTDVVVCADDSEAKQKVMALADAISGVRAVDGGGLANARYVEDLTALLLNINRIYKAHSMIKIVGI